jgi:hypothetical protein
MHQLAAVIQPPAGSQVILSHGQAGGNPGLLGGFETGAAGRADALAATVALVRRGTLWPPGARKFRADPE